jgi:hypothetical protein
MIPYLLPMGIAKSIPFGTENEAHATFQLPVKSEFHGEQQRTFPAFFLRNVSGPGTQKAGKSAVVELPRVILLTEYSRTGSPQRNQLQ